jgi:hypothetical protein
MSRRPSSRFDLAPRRTRPLAMWNPFDYLQLIYWVLFFPQALRWYVDTFAGIESDEDERASWWVALRDDPIVRGLVIQMSVLMGVGAALIPIIMGILEPVAVALSLIILLGASGFLARLSAGASSAVNAVGGALAGLLALLLMILFTAFWLASGFDLVIARDVWVGTFGGVVGIGVSTGFGFSAGVAPRVARYLVMGMTGIMLLSLTVTMGTGLAAIWVTVDDAIHAKAIWSGTGTIVTFVLLSTDTAGWLLAPLVRMRTPIGPLSRRTWLPIPGLQRALVRELEEDWQSGVRAVDNILAYSLQFVAAVRAVEKALARSRSDELLPRVFVLAEQVKDLALLGFCSMDIGHAMRRQVIGSFIGLPGRWRERWLIRYPSEPRLDTPTRGACAGFLHWILGDTDKAAEAFSRVRDLPFGQELSNIADALAHGYGVDSLACIADWHDATAWLQDPPGTMLRPGTIAALTALRAAAAEVVKACSARAPLNRVTALGRSGAMLQELIAHENRVRISPELVLIYRMAETWRDLVIKAGGAMSEEATRQRVFNPYDGYAGLPVHGSIFVGRLGAMREIERHWLRAETPPVIILYGHRRMGKTSILRNLEHGLPARTLLAFVDMQAAGLVDHTGQFLLELADVIHARAAKAGLDAGDAPDEMDYQSLGRGRRALDVLLTQLDPQMGGYRLVLAIDEFEVIEAGILKGCIHAEVLGYLRALNQRYGWLALVFGGLHTLAEMGSDYRNAFYSQTEHVRVSYLSRQDAMRLITQPHLDFALEYEPVLCEELFELTYGQPYLIQRLCWELVERWNDRLEHEGPDLEPVLRRTDLSHVLDDELYMAASYYFDGVWAHVTASERALMAILARRPEPWTWNELAHVYNDEAEESRDEVLARLFHHDVILEHDGRIRFASELMRRWVERRIRLDDT